MEYYVKGCLLSAVFTLDALENFISVQDLLLAYW